MRTIWQRSNFRIIEKPDNDCQLSDLKGDCYCPKTNPDIDPKILRQQELDFEREVNENGVFGYVLQERLNGNAGPWTHLDSCWGFVGAFDADSANYNHHIVQEFRAVALEKINALKIFSQLGRAQ